MVNVGKYTIYGSPRGKMNNPQNTAKTRERHGGLGPRAFVTWRMMMGCCPVVMTQNNGPTVRRKLKISVLDSS